MKTALLIIMLGFICSGFTREARSCVVAPTAGVPPGASAPINPPAAHLENVDLRVRSLHRLIEVQAVLASGVDRDTRFEYRTLWFDAGGMEIPSFPGSWFSGDIPGLGTACLLEIAPSPDAVSFTIECRQVYRDSSGHSHTQPISLCIRPK